MTTVSRSSRSILLNALLTLVALILIEGALHLASAFSPSIDRILAPPWEVREAEAQAVRQHLGEFQRRNWEDPSAATGGSGRNTKRFDHDEWGYRNPRVPTEVDVVALGDSHTYGTSVEREQAWPHRLTELLRAPVYNMGFPGYGPAHGLLNLRDALSLRPKLVVYAVYFGNDYFDAFTMAVSNPLIAAYAPPELLTASRQLEGEAPLGKEALRRFNLGQEKEASDTHQPEKAEESEPGSNASADSTSESESAELESAGFYRSTRRVISRHLKLYGLLRGLVYRTWVRSDMLPVVLSQEFEHIVKHLASQDMMYYSVYEGDEWRTIITAPYRNLVLEDADSRIRLGVEVTKEVLHQMARDVNSAGSEFIVLLLPTKERVFSSRIEDKARHSELEALVRNEDRLRTELSAYLRSKGIVVIDPLVELEHAKIQPYFSNADGHPTPHGHEIIASHLSEQIKLQVAGESSRASD